MTGHPGIDHTRIHPSHADAVARLEERYAPLGLRFDTGFAGSVPVQASGKIGRRFFYFRFRHDTASLTIGSPDHRRDRAYAKAQRTKALRATRRFTGGDIMDRIWAEHGLKPSLRLERHPSIPVRWAAIHDVTGEQYAGSLETDEAEALFTRLMDSLAPARKPIMGWPQLRLTSRGQRSFPMEHTRGVIAKAAKRRRQR
jgi:hypothetical protein